MSEHPAPIYASFRLQERTALLEAARQRHEAASIGVDLANIRYRAAEAESQHEPLASILTMEGHERDRLVAAIHYVVYGKTPTLPPSPSPFP